MFKKRILISLLIIVVSLIIAIPSFASTNGKITGKTVKLREKASLDSKLVMLLSVDNKVEVTEKDGDWYKVNYKDKTGYVFKDYIEVEGNLEEVSNNENLPEENTNENNNESNNDTNIENNNATEDEIEVPSQMKIVADTNIRILPVITSSTIFNIKQDKVVTVTEHINGWVYIVSDEASGWIRKEKLVVNNNVEQPNEPEKPAEKPDVTAEKPETEVPTKGYVNVDSVNVRKESNTTSEVLKKLVKNSEVTIVGKENDWSMVKVGDKTGYILSKYISDKKVEEVTNRSIDEPRENTDVATNNNVEKPKEPSTPNNTVDNTNTNTSKGNEIVSFANRFLGVPYKSAGASPSGFDCSGFTYYVFKNFGYTISRSSSLQANNGKEVSKENLKVGDLVFFSQGSKKIGHVGIYVGNNNFIHSSSPGDVVKITSLSLSYYKTRYVTARRII